MPDRDYYEVLGVDKSASAEQIKKAYRAQARKFHPDVNPGDKTSEAKFKETQNAYDILSDPEKKKLFDQFGGAAFEGGGPGPRAGAAEWAARQAGGGMGGGSGGFSGGGFENIDLSSIFGRQPQGGGFGEAEGGGSIFEELLGRVRGDRSGGKRKSSGNRAPKSTEVHLSIPFLTAVKGGETHIEVQREDAHSESLVVKVPPGIEPGAKLRLKGQGEASDHGGSRGDLTIVVAIAPHPYFVREGRNLSVDLPLGVGEAILGAKVEVPTLDGPKTLSIPAGTSTGSKLRLRGQGVPAFKDHPAGDLFVVVKVVVPKVVAGDDESRRLIEEFASKNPQNPRAGLW